MLTQDRKLASLRAYIFAPIRINLPTPRALRKHIRSSIRHKISLFFNMLLVLSIVASPLQASLAAAPTSTYSANPSMSHSVQGLPSASSSSPTSQSRPLTSCASGDVFCLKPATANINSSTAGNANDGDDGTSWAASSTYSTPWWQVDMQSEKVIN